MNLRGIQEEYVTGRAGRVNEEDEERAAPRAAPGFGNPGDAIQRG